MLDTLCKIELHAGASVRCLLLPLRGNGQKRIRVCRRWPGCFSEAGKPERIEGQASRFQNAENLDVGIAACFGLKESLVTELIQQSDRLFQSELAGHLVEPSKLVERLNKCLPCLEFDAVQFAIG